MTSLPIARPRMSLLLIAALAAGTPMLVPSRSLAAAAAPVASQQMIASSSVATLVVEPDGGVYGAGDNDSEQLTGTASYDYSLTRLAGLPAGVRGVAVADTKVASIVLGSNGKVYGSGSNAYDALTTSAGNGVDTLTPLTGMPAGVLATRIAAGADGVTVVLGNNGVVYGAGLNSTGELTSPPGDHATLSPLAGLPAGVKATAIAVGASHSLVLGSNGVAYASGDNTYGQITGSESGVSTLTPMQGLGSGVKAVGIAAGGPDSLVIGSDGKVYGAGDNSYDQLTSSVGSTASVLTPLIGLPDGVRAVAASVNFYTSVVIGSDGLVYGAGTNRENQLTGGTSYSSLTLLTHGIPDAVGEVVAGGNDIVARDDEGVVYGSGDNSYSQLTTNGGSPHTAGFEVLAGQREVSIAKPTISGTPRYGSRLVASDGRWSLTPDSYAYQWRANGAVIPGATGSTYQPSIGTIGLRISVSVTATRGGGFVDGAATSSSTARVGKGAALTLAGRPRPSIKGTHAAGHVLRLAHLATTGFTPSATSLSYQWLRNGTPIAHATTPAFRIKAADRGAHVSVRVTAHRSGYAAGTYVTHAVSIKRS